MDVARALASIINAELRALAAAGATFIQLDEPSYAVHPDSPRDFVDLFNTTVAGLRDAGAGKPPGDAHADAAVPRPRDAGVKIGIHFCFGNYVGRPVAKRTYRPRVPHILDAHADQFALEFANRELAELDLWRDFPSDKELAAGVLDVKNYYVETPQDVADRIRAALDFVKPDKLTIVPDCGLSQTARWAAKSKLRAMVEGTQIIRHELAG